MGDRSKIEARRKNLRVSAESGGDQSARFVVRCASCDKAGQATHIQMGGCVFCDECIEAAASIVGGKKAGR